MSAVIICKIIKNKVGKTYQKDRYNKHQTKQSRTPIHTLDAWWLVVGWVTMKIIWRHCMDYILTLWRVIKAILHSHVITYNIIVVSFRCVIDEYMFIASWLMDSPTFGDLHILTVCLVGVYSSWINLKSERYVLWKILTCRVRIYPAKWVVLFLLCMVQAKCCADRLHCCPSGFQCDISNSGCRRKDEFIPWTAKQLQMQLPLANSFRPNETIQSHNTYMLVWVIWVIATVSSISSISSRTSCKCILRL